jgi:hypothetical protein
MYFYDKNDAITYILTEKAMLIFKEISSGVYNVDKDRKGGYSKN